MSVVVAITGPADVLQTGQPDTCKLTNFLLIFYTFSPNLFMGMHSVYDGGTMPSPAESSRSHRFGQIVQARIDELRLTKKAIYEVSGLSAPTIRKIVAGEEVSVATLNKLDRPLKWAPGSAVRASTGGDPRLLRPAEEGGEELVIAARGVRFELADLAELLSVSRKVNDAVTGTPEAGECPALTAAVGELNRFVSRVSARYATPTLERNGGPGTRLHPLIEMAFAHLLDVPAEAANADDLHERLYRRWLAGRDVDINDETREQFTQRWSTATGRLRPGDGPDQPPPATTEGST